MQSVKKLIKKLKPIVEKYCESVQIQNSSE